MGNDDYIREILDELRQIRRNTDKLRDTLCGGIFSTDIRDVIDDIRKNVEAIGSVKFTV